MAAESPQRDPVVPQLVEQAPDLRGGTATVVCGGVRLDHLNTIEAVLQGVQAGQAAILDVLGIGPRVLGAVKE